MSGFEMNALLKVVQALRAVRIVQFVILGIAVLAPILAPLTVSARPAEPGKMDPARDAAYISTLGIHNQNWNDPIINILIVGQDAQTSFHKGVMYTRPNGQKVPDLTSHADGNMMLSFNKRTGEVSIISLYRGYIVHEEHWASVPEAPPAAMVAGLTNRYLANYYLYAGRAKYLSYAKGALDSFIRSRRLEKQYLINDELRIHGVVETGFDGFKSAMGQFLDYFGSSATIAWKMKGHAGTLFQIFRNRDDLMRELRSQPGYQAMTEKRKQELADDPSRVILGTLRERQNYEGGGYQRAFNHSKFISYVLGLVGYTMAEADFVDFLKEPAIVKAFETFSRTFDMKTFDSNLRTSDRGLHMMARAGFRAGESPMYLIQIGTSISNYAVYNAGKFAVINGGGFLASVDPKVQLIPKPSDCPSCRLR